MKRLGLNRNLTVMCGTIFSNVFFAFTWNPLLPLYFRSLGANDWDIGIAFTLMGIARTVFAVFGGALADRFGRKRLLVVPIVGMIPLYLIVRSTGDWAVLLAIFVVTNALNALTGPAFSAVIAESSTEDQVARSFSLSEFSVLGGLIAGPIAGAALLGILDIPAMIALNAVVLIATTAARGWGLQETRHRVTGNTLPKLFSAIDSNVRWCMVMVTLLTFAFSLSFGPYFAILLRDAWHNSEAEINLLFAAGNVASMLGIGLGRMSDRWGAQRVFMLGMFGYGISTLAWGIAPGWEWGLLPLLFAFGFSEAAWIATETLQAEITTRETRTSVFGIITTVTGVLGGMGPTLGAWLIALGGNPMPFLAAGVSGLLAMAAILPVRSRKAGIQLQPAALQAE